MAVFSRSLQLSLRPHHDGKLGFHPVRKEEVVQIFTRSCLSATRRQISLWCSINSKHDASQEFIVETNVTNSLFSFKKDLILVNSMMLILPIQTLAETCKADYSVLSMGRMALLFAVASIGATVGGWLARKRKEELKRVNDQLRQINETLRRQAQIESYAPDLSYAPVGRTKDKEIVVDPRKEQLISCLRSGKSFLRMQDFERATVDFQLALDLAQALEDHAEEKKAARGLGASLQRQGNFKEAIMYYSRVLALSKMEGEAEDSAATEAYGAIADCFTELGDLERAAKFYDKYIGRLKSN